MRTLFVLCTAAVVSLPSAILADTAPDEVTFMDSGAVTDSLTGVPGDAAAGLEVATSKSLGNCMACHAAKGWEDVPLPGNIGPLLTGVGHRYNESQLRGIVTNAKHTFPDSMMPSFYNTANIIRPGDGFTGKAATETVTILTAQQVEDLVALLKTFTEDE